MIPSIKTVAVIGAGQMGVGIAHAVALGGYRVRLYDVVPDQLPLALGVIAAALARQVERQTITQAEADVALAGISGVATLAEAARADLVIEAAFEDEAVKKAVFAELVPHLGPDTLLASNTSSISITRLASATASGGGSVARPAVERVVQDDEAMVMTSAPWLEARILVNPVNDVASRRRRVPAVGLGGLDVLAAGRDFGADLDLRKASERVVVDDFDDVLRVATDLDGEVLVTAAGRINDGHMALNVELVLEAALDARIAFPVDGLLVVDRKDAPFVDAIRDHVCRRRKG